jgi:hypothetical protein
VVDPDALIEFLIDQGIEATVVEDGTEVLMDCPSCGSKKMYVEAESGVYICFRCDDRGDLFDLFRRALGMTPAEAFEARRRLRFRTGPRFRFGGDIPTPVPGVALPLEYAPVDLDTSTGKWPGLLEYLVSRHLPYPRVLSYKIGYCEDGPYAGRIIIPVEYHNQLYTFVARALDPTVEPKVLYPAGSRRSDVVFNLDRLERLQHPRPLIITEGVFDALRVPNQAVAILGSSISAQQITLLGRLPVGWRPFIIMMDGDKAGRNASGQIHRALWSHGIPHVEARLPEGTDPNDAPQEVLDATIKDALEEAS